MNLWKLDKQSFGFNLMDQNKSLFHYNQLIMILNYKVIVI